jgi:hypothetical protein
MTAKTVDTPAPTEEPQSSGSGVPVALLVTGAIAAPVIAGAVGGLPIGFLTASGIVVASVVGLVWQSLQHLSGDAELTLEEALSLAAPTAEEEQKRAILRSLKDLDYELRVGKISKADYVELSARYRAEAKRLIVVVDESLAPQRARAEQLLEERLKELGLPEEAPAAPAPSTQAVAEAEAEAEAGDAPTQAPQSDVAEATKPEADGTSPSEGATALASSAPADKDSSKATSTDEGTP